jgi:hypothetical protein
MSTEIAKQSNTAVGTPGSWKERLKGYAKQSVAIADEAGGGGNFLSFKAGQITYKGAAVVGNKLDVIILEAVLEYADYVGDFDSDNPQPPICYAFGRTEEEMKPHPKAPQPQHDKCIGCPQNEFGSAEKGRGKHCKNIMRLAVIPGTPLDADTIKKSDASYIRIPVMSVGNYTSYAKKLSALHDLPPFAVVTQLGTVPDAKSQFRVTFEDVKHIEDEALMEMLMAQHEAQCEAIMFPYSVATVTEKEEKPAPKGKKKF